MPMLVPVYDIRNCGPRHRFVANGKLVHNSDKVNFQNLPARGEFNALKNAILAPPGHVIIDCDSSQIEARVLAWLAGQDDLVQAFANREDVYKIMASKIYKKPVEEITKNERFMGKTVVLGCGYGLGAKRFRISLKGLDVEITAEDAQNIIDAYRNTYSAIPKLWRQGDNCLGALYEGEVNGTKKTTAFGMHTDAVALYQDGFHLPSGYILGYAELQREEDRGRQEYTYKSRKGRTKIYGGKVVENVTQAVARCIIAEQMVKISKRYKVVLTVHDAITCVVPEADADSAQRFIERCMREPPAWARGLPLGCESGIGKRYGEC